jgi:hypothetical protein
VQDGGAGALGCDGVLSPGDAPGAGIGQVGRHGSVEIELPGFAHSLQLLHEVVWELQPRKPVEALLPDDPLERLTTVPRQAARI